MPHGNSPSKRGGKKGKTCRPSETTNAVATVNAPAAAIPIVGEQYHSNDDRVWKLESAKSKSNIPKSGRVHWPGDNFYARYKKSTQRMKNKLQAMVPPYIFEMDTVQALLDATDYVVQHGLTVDRGLLSDLKQSIRIRRKVAIERYGGGDTGHGVFIAVLEYCWSHLRPLRQKRIATIATPSSPDRKETDVPQVSNRFERLATEENVDENIDKDVDEDEVAYVDDEDDDEEDLPTNPRPRPPDSIPLLAKLQDLIAGTSRSNSVLFLANLECLMESTAVQMAKLNEATAAFQAKKGTSSIDDENRSSVVHAMMQASIAANLAIQQVQSLEETFIKDNPHLNTVYRLLASAVMDDAIERLTAVVVAKQSPLTAQFSEKDAIQFVGDAMECAFRDESDRHSKRLSLVSHFLKRWKFLNDAVVPINVKVSGANGAVETATVPWSVQKVFDQVSSMVELETTFVGLERSSELETLSAHFGRTSHSWVFATYIGGDRSITQTIRLLQLFSGYIEKKSRNGQLRMCYFNIGTAWDDLKRPVSRIAVDMDQLLMNDILPALIGLCYEGVMCMDLMYEDEILSGFVQIKKFADQPELPVSWALAFTLHTMLTAFFETQEANHLPFLAETAQLAFETYIERLEWAKRARIPTFTRPPNCDHNIESLLEFKRLLKVPGILSRNQVTRSLWNPYTAGAVLSYIAYYGNLAGGSLLVDSVSQLRMTMHLYNALVQVGALFPGQIAILESIFEVFKDCKALWDGQLPVATQFETKWLLSYGMNATWARDSFGRSQVEPSAAPERRVTPIDAPSLSNSFRRVCLRDFHGVVDRRGIKKPKRKEQQEVYKHLVRLGGTMDAMESDIPLLGMNMVSLGYYTNKFIVDFFIHAGWMPGCENLARIATAAMEQGIMPPPFQGVDLTSWQYCGDNLKYQAMSQAFALKVMRPLDKGDSEVALKWADYMEDYFNKITPEMIGLF